MEKLNENRTKNRKTEKPEKSNNQQPTTNRKIKRYNNSKIKTTWSDIGLYNGIHVFTNTTTEQAFFRRREEGGGGRLGVSSANKLEL